MFKIPRGIATLIALALLLSVSVMAFPQQAGGTLTMALKEKLDTLDVFTSALSEPLRVLGVVCETLVVYDENVEVQPLLAESWEVSADQLTWTFYLKQGINFHDGSAFNAQSLKDYLWDWMFPKSFNGWEFEPVTELVVVDEYTLNFVLDQPYPMLLTYLGDPWNIIQSPTAYEQYGDRYGFDTLVGTGPFMFDEWVRGERIILKRDPSYNHGPAFLDNQGPAYLDTLVFRIIPEAITRVSELRFGDVDLIRTVPENMLSDIQGDANIVSLLAPSFRVIYVACNMDSPIMQDKQLREAINHAIDRQAVLNATFSGYGSIAYSLLPPGATGFWSGSEEFAKTILTYDPALSRQLLDEAGWTLPAGKSIREKDGQQLELNLVAMNVPRYSLPAEIVTAMLSDVGVAVNLEIYDAAAASARLEAGEFDLTTTGWAYNVGEVSLDLIVGSPSIPNPNYARYNSADIDAALEIVRLGATAAERSAAAASVQQMVVTDQIVIPLVVRSDSIGAKKQIGGLEKLNEHPWWLDLSFALELYIKN